MISTDFILGYGAGKAAGNGTFVVTLTPTAENLSGTMDKSPDDIAVAIARGMRIMFSIPSLSASVEATQFINGVETVAAANVIYDINEQHALIHIATDTGDSTYHTAIYPLTPM